MVNNPVIYCIPGLGLDHRVFGKLKIQNAQLKFLDFIDPLENEKISDYAKRISDAIKEDNFCLLGMSLGGILSVEISRIRKVDHLFLISTIKNKSEMPTIMKFIDKLPTKSKTASKLAVEASVAFKPYYDKSDAAGNELFDKMIHAASVDFLAWGIKEIANWEFDEELNCPFYHLQGTTDLIFPIKNIDRAETVKGAAHYMIYNNDVDLSKRIEARIKILASK